MNDNRMELSDIKMMMMMRFLSFWRFFIEDFFILIFFFRVNESHLSLMRVRYFKYRVWWRLDKREINFDLDILIEIECRGEFETNKVSNMKYCW